jgi:hypothetical protein
VLKLQKVVEKSNGFEKLQIDESPSGVLGRVTSPSIASSTLQHAGVLRTSGGDGCGGNAQPCDQAQQRC